METTTKYQIPEETLENIRSLEAEMEATKLSEARFAAEYLPFTQSVWNRIRAAVKSTTGENYFDLVKDRDALCIKIEEALRDAREKRKLKARMGQDPIVKTLYFRKVEQAVRECGVKENPERIIKFLSPTGGGKSKLCDFLKVNFGAAVVEAHSGWKRSRYQMLCDFCRALKVRGWERENDPNKLVKLIVKTLNERPALLVIDEAEYFGREALDTIKQLLNETRIVIVMCADPGGHDEWNRYFAYQANHIARRTHATIYCVKLKAEDVHYLIPPALLQEPERSATEIARRASQFGHFSLIRRVRDGLTPDAPASHADVNKVLTLALSDMGKAGVH